MAQVIHNLVGGKHHDEVIYACSITFVDVLHQCKISSEIQSVLDMSDV